MSDILTPKQREYLKEAKEYITNIYNDTSGNFNKTLALQTISAMISNIINDPNEQKYRKIKMNNQKFQKRVLETTEDAAKLLELIGFKPKGDYFLCSEFNVESLKLMKEELDKQVLKSFYSNENLKHVDDEDEVDPELSLTVTIDGNDYKRPILKIFKVVKDNALFEVPEHYEVKKVLGFGSFGVVVSAYDHIKKKEVAIKKMYATFSQSMDYQKRILREIQLLLHFRGCESIVEIIDLIPPRSFEDFSDVYIVMDCMSQDLNKLIKSTNQLTDENVVYFMYHMLLGVYSLHSANCLHRDLKPSNVLLTGELDVRICDLGLARGLNLGESDDQHMSTYYVVTRWYRSPELVMSYEKSYKALDMWSIGCIFAELLQKPKRRPLFPGMETLEQLKLILNTLGKQKFEDIKGVPNAKNFVKQYAKNEKKAWNEIPFLKHISDESTLDLLDALLTFNPEKRISVEDALRHPYFREIFDEDDLMKYPIVDFVFDQKSANKDKDYCKKMIYDLIMDMNKKNGIAGE
eukprot:gene8837-785_t